MGGEGRWDVREWWPCDGLLDNSISLKVIVKNLSKLKLVYLITNPNRSVVVTHRLEVVCVESYTLKLRAEGRFLYASPYFSAFLCHQDSTSHDFSFALLLGVKAQQGSSSMDGSQSFDERCRGRGRGTREGREKGGERESEMVCVCMCV